MSRGVGGEEWLFVIDTEQYSGNFEREMGAYLTGMLGECFPGGSEELAELYKKETGDDGDESQFAGILGTHEYDGEHHPEYVAIWPTPGWWNNGNGKHFRDEDFKREQAKRKRPLVKYPAYQSVALIFTKRPTAAQLGLLNQRAKDFPDAYKRAELGGKVTVTGTRLLRKTTTYSVAKQW